MRAVSLLIFLFSIMVTNTVNATEMTFKLSGNGGNCNGCEWVAAQGEITENTPNAFKEYVRKSGGVYFVVLNSGGGNLAAGIELGRLIRQAGANTSIGETKSLTGDLSHLEEMAPGVCASACAFAFMGGVERWIGDKDRIGVHQFYSMSDKDINSETVQKLVGLTLMHSLVMGIDPAVIVAASGTSSNQMYWFNEEERSQLRLDTSGSVTEPWRFEPYKRGLVLTTTHKESVRRSVDVTIFCRSEDSRHYILISEEHKYYAEQQLGKGLLKFEGRYINRPTLKIGEKQFGIGSSDVEFQVVKNGRFLVSVRLPVGFQTNANKIITFDPDLARVYSSLIYVSVTLPATSWLASLSRNCI